MTKGKWITPIGKNGMFFAIVMKEIGTFRTLKQVEWFNSDTKALVVIPAGTEFTCAKLTNDNGSGLAFQDGTSIDLQRVED